MSGTVMVGWAGLSTGGAGWVMAMAAGGGGGAWSGRAGALVEAVGWTLLHFVWQGAAVAVALACLLALARGASAGFRYAAGCGALLVMAAAFASTLVEEARRASERAGAAAAHEAAPPTLAGAGLTTGEAVTGGVGESGGALPPAVLSGAGGGGNPQGVTGAARNEGSEEQRLGGAGASEFIRAWLPVLVALWLAGVAAQSLRMGRSWVAARRLKAGAAARLEAPWPARFGALCARLGVSRPVGLLVSSAVSVPVVVAWLKPAVLVPAGIFSRLTPDQLEAVLAHELAHVRRHDYLVNLMQAALEAVLFYQPAVWWVSKRVRLERELCCDDVAAEVCGSARDYAGALTALEEWRSGAAAAPALGVAASGGSLLARVRRLVGAEAAGPTGGRDRGEAFWLAPVMGVVFLLAAGLVVAGTPSRAADDRPPTRPPGAGAALETGAAEAVTEVDVEPTEVEAPVAEARAEEKVRAEVGPPGVETVAAADRADDSADTWRLRLIEGESQRPFARADVVLLTWPDNPHTAEETRLTTDDGGVVETGVSRDASVVVQLAEPGWVSARVIRRAGPGVRGPEAVLFWKGHIVRGQMLLPDRRPAADTAVRAGVYVTSQEWKGRLGMPLIFQSWDQGQWPNWLAYSRTDGEGRFVATVPPFDAHMYLRILCTVEGGAPFEAEFEEAVDDVGSLRIARGVGLSGRVVDGEGRPMSGVALITSGRRGAYQGRRTTTDEDGGFSFPPLEPGATKLSIFARKPESNDVRAVFAVRTINLVEGGPDVDVTLRPEPERMLAFAWDDQRTRWGNPPSFRVSGTLERGGEKVNWSGETFHRSGADGVKVLIRVPVDLNQARLILGANLGWLPYYEGPGGTQPVNAVKLGPVDAKGARTIRAVDSRRVRLRVVDPGGKPLDDAVVSGRATGRFGDRKMIRFQGKGEGVYGSPQVYPGESVTYWINHRGSLSAEGSVAADAIAKSGGEAVVEVKLRGESAEAHAEKLSKGAALTVLDTTGRIPIPEFRIVPGRPNPDAKAGDDSDRRVLWQPGKARTVRGGGYIWPLEEIVGRMAIRIEAPGRIPQTWPWLENDGQPRHIIFQLQDDPGVEGRVLRPDGGPAAGAKVSLVLPGDVKGVVHGNYVRTTVAAGEDGGVTLPAEPDPAAMVWVDHKTGSWRGRFADFREADGIRLTRPGAAVQPPPAAEPEPAPEPAAIEVRGRVVDDETGEPVAPLIVQAGKFDRADPSQVTWGWSEGRSSRRDGSFSTTVRWHAGWTARVLADGYLPHPVLTEAPPEGAKSIDVSLRLVRGKLVRGRVLDHEGQPVGGASVFALGPAGLTLADGKAWKHQGVDEAAKPVRTGADGRFELPAGDAQRIAVSSPDFHAWPAEVVEGGETVVRLPEPARVEVRLDIPGAGDELPVFFQFLTREFPAFKRVQLSRSLNVKNGGRLEIAGLPPGNYQFCRQRLNRMGDFGTTAMLDRQFFELAPGETKEIRYIRMEGATVRGSVKIPDDADLKGVLITVEGEEEWKDPFDGFGWTTEYDARTISKDNTFKTERLPPGRYLLKADGYAKERNDGGFSSGFPRPEIRAEVVVEVPASGEVDVGELELK